MEQNSDIFSRKLLYNIGVIRKQLIPQTSKNIFSSEKFMEWRFYKVINEKSIRLNGQS